MSDVIEDEEDDLYSDLPNFKYDETVDKLQAGNKELQARVLFLEDVLEKQTKELDGIRSQCETLTKNISSLLKTAQNEIKRKDNKINELNKMVLELKTEILTLKKRKYDDTKSTRDEEPVFKQQKLDNERSVKSAVSQFFCDSEVVEDSTNLKGSHGLVIDKSQRQYAPDIKCHTVYSKRMYNKIYNTENVDSSIKKQNVENRSSDVYLKNEVETKINTKLEEKKSYLKPKSNKEKVYNEQLDQTDLNLHEEGAIFDPVKNKKSNTCTKNNNPTFNVFRNENLNTDYKKAYSVYRSDEMDGKQIIPPPGSKGNEINKEMCTEYNTTSARREKSLDHSYDESIKHDIVQGKSHVIGSITNRSSNFSKTENISKDVSIRHYTQNSKMSSVANEDALPKTKNLKSFEKTDILSYKINSKCNSKIITESKEDASSQLSKNYCLKKAKKSIKSVICPISGEWIKNTEALPHSNVIEMDAFKNDSTHLKSGKEDLDIMESLFGSPLKWTENSIDDCIQVEKLSPPATAFEDSCSANIENVKFKETRNSVTEVSETKITELSLTKKFSYTERKCYFQPSKTETNIHSSHADLENKSDISLSRDIIKQSNITHWPFKKTNNDIPSKNRLVTSPTFSTFVNTESTSEACDVPSSLKNNPNTSDPLSPSTKFSTSPKYNDSVLGQFDDTTQLISALAKDPSKLSPIHTPIKEAKSDKTNTKTQSQSSENIAVKPLSLSVDKDVLVSSVTIHKEPSPSVNENKSVSAVKDSLTIKKPVKSNIVDKRMSITKPITSTVEKKLSIPASVISSVEKKLSFPFSTLSPVNKKVEKKTILLEQPVNILCPRKTPRQIGSCKQTSVKKQNVVRDMIKNGKDEVDFIKSPSPAKEKQSIPESKSQDNVSGNNNSLKDDENDYKNRNIITDISSKLEGNKISRSPSNTFAKNKRADGKNVYCSLVSENRNSINERKISFKKDHSPFKEKTKHSCSRKENFPQRREHKSPSIRENSPLKPRRDQRQVQRDFKKEIFKHPVTRRESFKRPNCHFRLSSVERKIAKDWRHSAKARMFPVKTGNSCESARIYNNKGNKNVVNSKIIDSDEKQYSNKNPLITRSSRISWSSSTGVVSTKSPKVQLNNESTATPPSEMKWILRPIDFSESPNALKDSSIKSFPETYINTLESTAEAETSMSKYSQIKDSSLISPGGSSPAKSIVIVAERRPIKFGSNN